MKQVALLLSLAAIMAFSLSGLIPIPKAKSNLASPAPLQNAKILPKYADIKGQNLQLANFEVVGEIQPVCQVGGKIAVNLLLDTSTSMTCDNSKGACKINSMKSAVNNFIDKLPDNTLIGIQTLLGKFVETNTLGTIGKEALKAKISAIKPENGTPTQKGLQFAQTALTSAKTTFPEYPNQILIMLTDGCPNKGQKPIPVATEIKKTGVRIITIGLELGGAGKCDDGYEGAVKMMSAISSPGDYIDADAAGLDQKFDEILGMTASCSAAEDVCVAGKRPAVNLLIDTSASMQPHMDRLKTDLITFGASFKDTDVIGMQSFSGGGSRGVSLDVLPIDTYGNNKSKFIGAVNSLSADLEGWTYMKTAVGFAKSKIEGYRAVPNYKDWALVLLSDGFPQTKTSNGAYDALQDPTADIEALKSRGMRVVTIALGDQVDKELMKKLASNEANDYFEAPTADYLQILFPRIFQSFECDPSASPASSARP